MAKPTRVTRRRATQREPAPPLNGQRPLFRDMSGHFQFSRVIEQLIPSVIIGVLVIFANLKVTENQVSDIRKELDRAAILEQTRQQQLQQQSERLVGITAQLTAFLGQQVNINSAIDARLTYIERSQTVAGKR